MFEYFWSKCLLALRSQVTAIHQELEQEGYCIMKLSYSLQAEYWSTVILFLYKGCETHGCKMLHKMRTHLMARSRKPKRTLRGLQYIAKISCNIILSLKFWANIFRQENHEHFRQKCVFPLSFQTGVSIKGNHSPLAGPCLQQWGEGLKFTTTSSSTLQGGDGAGILPLLLVSITTRVYNSSLLASGLTIQGHY